MMGRTVGREGRRSVLIDALDEAVEDVAAREVFHILTTEYAVRWIPGTSPGMTNPSAFHGN